MTADGHDTIEALIARWLETGEGEAPLLRQIDNAIASLRTLLAARFGEQIADDVVESASFHVWRKLQARRYDPNRTFRSWLVVVLKNRCRDAIRKARRRPASFTSVFSADPESQPPDITAPTPVLRLTDRAEAFQSLAAEIDRILQPAECIVFAVAAGIADHVSAEQLDSWCRAHDPRDAFRRSISQLLAVPIYGRQIELAPLLGLRPATCRKRYQRATEKLAARTTDERLRRLIRDCIQRRDPPAS